MDLPTSMASLTACIRDAMHCVDKNVYIILILKRIVAAYGSSVGVEGSIVTVRIPGRRRRRMSSSIRANFAELYWYDCH